MYEANRTHAPVVPTRRQFLRWSAAGAALLGAGASGCTSAVDQAAEKGSRAARGGELVIAQGVDIVPRSVISQSAQNAAWRRQVFDCLVTLDRKTHAVRPALSTNWKSAEGGRVTTLTLRDGVTWHSGRAFEAEDVKFTLEFMRDVQPPFAFNWLLKRLDGIEVDDRRTVRLAFTEPVNNLFDMLSLMILVDRESSGDLLDGGKVIGTGPFVYGEYQQGTSLRLKRNPRYWASGRPLLDNVLVRIMTRPEARMAALRSGQVHLATGVSPQDLGQIEGDERFTATPYDTYTSCVYLGGNVNVDLLKDKRVRQAIQYAVDRKRIGDEVYRGDARVGATPWSTTSPAHDPRLAARYARDVNKARTMLRDAGAEGAEIVLQSAQPVRQVAEIVEFNLREAGLKPKLEVLNATQQQERVQNHTFEGLFIGQHGYNNLAPVNLVYSAGPYRLTGNMFNFSAKEYEDLADRALTAGESERRSAYTAVTEFLLDEAFCCDLVQATNIAVSSGVTRWDYTVWNDVIADSAALA